MIFQTLDTKDGCSTIYLNGNLRNEWDSSHLTHTWTASPFLGNLDIEYAYLYSQKDIVDSCPDFLREDLAKVQKKLRAFMVSFSHAKIDLNENCFYDLLPKFFLTEMCEVKNQITEYTLKNHERPRDYPFLKELLVLTQEISNRKLNLNFLKPMKDPENFSLLTKINNLKNVDPYVRYDIFGTKTGRMTVLPNTFPILNLNKSLRCMIEPTNDWFAELDYNAFELRILLYLLDVEQPNLDLHEWNVTNVFHGKFDRDHAKKEIFSWLYNLDRKDENIDKIYNRKLILEKYWNGVSVTNPFGNVIESDQFHAISYLIQRTASDIIFRQMLKIKNLLNGKKSFIAFTVHDSVVLDMAEEDKHLLPEIKKEFSCFRGTNFLSKIRTGRDYGDMKER